MVLPATFRDSPFAVNMSRCDGLNVGMLLMSLKGHKIQFNIQGQIGCYRVTVSETVVMPPQSEIVVNGKVNDRFPILFKVGLVEPTEDFRKSDKALVGRTLVKTNKDIPLRLMNVSSQPSCLAYPVWPYHIHPVGGRESVLEVPLPALHFRLRFHV
jgi:hypothetical protein